MNYCTSIEKFLYSIIYSGFYSKSDWQKWADKMISNNNEVDNWIYNLSLASNKDEALKAVCGGSELYCPPYKFDMYKTVEGYLYLLYKQSRIKRNDFLLAVGDLEDGYDGGGCAIFYSMIDNGGKYEEKIDNHLEPYADEALSQKEVIETLTYNQIVTMRNKSADELYSK